MKAQRRHDLKTNTLARSIEGVPNFWREHGNRLLLIVLVAAVVFLLVRYWNEKKAKDAQSVTINLQTAHTELGMLAQLPFRLAEGAPPAGVAQERDLAAQQAEQAISTVLSLTKDKKVMANVYLLRGDLNWDLANFPPIPGSDTQPSLDVPNRDGLLEKAAASYQQVLDPSFGANLDDLFYARTGLAAIAENQGQWEKSKQQYQAILDASNMTAGYKAYAKERLEHLPEIESSVLLVPPPTVAATTEPVTSAPSVPFRPPAPTRNPTTGTTQPTSEPLANDFLILKASGSPTTRPTITIPAVTR